MRRRMAAPADDTPKLFVGQVPRDWDADALRGVLEEAGNVHEVIIVRDRGTRESKGGYWGRDSGTLRARVFFSPG